MNFAISETVIQKVNAALGMTGQPHKLFLDGAVIETGAMEWAEAPGIPAILANISPELKDAMQRSQQYLQQEPAADPQSKLQEFFSHEPVPIQAQYAEYLTKLQAASSPAAAPMQLPEISQGLQEAIQRVDERLQGEHFNEGKSFLGNYLKRMDELFQEEPAHIQEERLLLAAQARAITEMAQAASRKKALTLKQVRNLLAGDSVIAYRAGIAWEGVPSLSYHTIVVAATVDPWDILRIEKTNGTNRGLSTEDLIEKLRGLDWQYGIDIVGAAIDGVELVLKRIPRGKEAQELGKWLLQLCPDLGAAPRSFPHGKVSLWWD